jgi:hypothetical protein
MRQCAPVRHLPQKCPRNLKNEMPLNKSPKTVIENFLFNELSVFFTGIFLTATASLHLRARNTPPTLMALIAVCE